MLHHFPCGRNGFRWKEALDAEAFDSILPVGTALSPFLLLGCGGFFACHWCVCPLLARSSSLSTPVSGPIWASVRHIQLSKARCRRRRRCCSCRCFCPRILSFPSRRNAGNARKASASAVPAATGTRRLTPLTPNARPQVVHAIKAFAPVQDAHLAVNPGTGDSLRACYVEFQSVQHAQHTLETAARSAGGSGGGSDDGDGSGSDGDGKTGLVVEGEPASVSYAASGAPPASAAPAIAAAAAAAAATEEGEEEEEGSVVPPVAPVSASALTALKAFQGRQVRGTYHIMG